MNAEQINKLEEFAVHTMLTAGHTDDVVGVIEWSNALSWNSATLALIASMQGDAAAAERHQRDCDVECDTILFRNRLLAFIDTCSVEMRGAQDADFTQLQLWQDAAAYRVCDELQHRSEAAKYRERVNTAATQVLESRAWRTTRVARCHAAVHRAVLAASRAASLAFDGATRNLASQCEQFAQLAATRHWPKDAEQDAEHAQAMCNDVVARANRNRLRSH